MYKEEFKKVGLGTDQRAFKLLEYIYRLNEQINHTQSALQLHGGARSLDRSSHQLWEMFTELELSPSVQADREPVHPVGRYKLDTWRAPQYSTRI